jgi:transposase
MSIVMGIDQHRAQITAEWIDVATGEISRARVRPADRAGVRRFLARFAGEQLEVALEATTGWRFFVEELRGVGAVVHLAEPAETAALRGSKKRAKSDRADARHHRELLLAGRLPESWIPPDHILDHTLRELGDDALAPPAEQTRSRPGSAAARRASSGSPRRTNASPTTQAHDALAA